MPLDRVNIEPRASFLHGLPFPCGWSTLPSVGAPALPSLPSLVGGLPFLVGGPVFFNLVEKPINVLHI